MSEPSPLAFTSVPGAAWPGAIWPGNVGGALSEPVVFSAGDAQWAWDIGAARLAWQAGNARWAWTVGAARNT